MTDDTKRALEILKPIADELRIEMKATDKLLIMNGQAIGIACNSTHATLLEAIGWIFAERYMKDFRDVYIEPDELNDTVKRYWVSKEVLQKIMGADT